MASTASSSTVEQPQTWQKRDIIFLAVVGPFVLAAFLEWLLWLIAWCYCLYKAFRKAEKWQSKVLAVFMTLFFVVFRSAFLPAMVVTLPLPAMIISRFPRPMVLYLSWFAFYAFAILLVVPWLFCIYQITTKSVGRKRVVKYDLDERTAPKTVVVMPCYKEHPDVLWKAVNSVVNCEYPAACIHVFLSFDGDDVDELYLTTIDRLGIPVTMKDFPQSIDVVYNGARVTVSRFVHGGKRHCQKATFRLIDKVYQQYLLRHDNLFILFIDSDCILDAVCIQNFMYEMELKPGRKHDMLAMTGIITATTEKQSFITLLQDIEYIHGQLFERSVESGCGAVTCLPGALTILRFSAFKNMSKYYFSDKAEQCNDLFDYGKCHLGEDRWLTHLFMVGAKHRYQIQLCTNAFCKTEAVQTFRSLLKQRRRWFLGFLTNEVCMLTDVRLWIRYPLLCVVRFMQNTIRTTSMLFLIMVISVATTSNAPLNLPWGFIAVSLGLNYVLMFYFGWKLKRFKAWLYPLMFLFNPLFNWLYMIYGIFTAGQRTWGGPRADAGAADEKTTAQQAIEHAHATGDDLNVVPETFLPAAEARRRIRSDMTGLQPPPQVEGRFAAAEELPGGWFRQCAASGMSLHAAGSGHGRRDSNTSCETSDSEDISLHTPRRVESLIDEQEMARRANDFSNSPSASYPSNERAEWKAFHETQNHHCENRRFSTQEQESRQEPQRARMLHNSHQSGADPFELSRRLTSLHPPPPIYDGTSSVQLNRSPLGRTSPMRRTEERSESLDYREGQAGDIAQPDRGIFLQPPPSSGRRLHKRNPSAGDVV